ncbi:MAG: IS1 family transposase [Alphaproteobacteria bacterium]|nr:IS1 family transposase [Alphaproteobacteria bacterium]
MNQKSVSDRAKILQLLVEGNSLRAASRISDVSINTVYKLLVEVGEVCANYQDIAFRNLPCRTIQVDEIWSFIYAKRKNVTDSMTPDAGDVWTWVAICAETKLVPCWHVGGRNAAAAREFMCDLAPRMANKIHLTSDGFGDYPQAVEEAFGIDVDYAMLVKMYEKLSGKREKYKGADKKIKVGRPDIKKVSTSYVERQNLTMRMGIRRFTRKTNAFSKKIENHCHAIALHFMYYNFCRIHKSLRISPAMAANVTDKLWTLEDLVNMMDAYFDNKER